jgi:hypothetical protein
MRRALLTLGCLLLLAAAPAAASAKTETASSGNVSATFSYDGSGVNATNLRLSISRNGSTLYDQPVTADTPPGACPPCAPGYPSPSVRVLDLGATGEREVVLGLYTKGAHCCTIEQVYSFDPTTNTYVKTERNFGDPGATIKDLGHNHHFEFVSADDNFAYEFTDFAASGMPIQIWGFSGSGFVDITRHYPKLIRKDAVLWWREYKHNPSDNLGLFAAWAADEDLLGHSKLVSRTLASEARKGHLPGARAYVRHLTRFLRQHGYTR